MVKYGETISNADLESEVLNLSKNKQENDIFQSTVGNNDMLRCHFSINVKDFKQKNSLIAREVIAKNLREKIQKQDKVLEVENVRNRTTIIGKSNKYNKTIMLNLYLLTKASCKDKHIKKNAE